MSVQSAEGAMTAGDAVIDGEAAIMDGDASITDGDGEAAITAGAYTT